MTTQATPTTEKPQLEQAMSCCSPVAQATCCEPPEKSDCGTEAAAGGDCQCQ